MQDTIASVFRGVGGQSPSVILGIGRFAETKPIDPKRLWKVLARIPDHPISRIEGLLATVSIQQSRASQVNWPLIDTLDLWPRAVAELRRACRESLLQTD
jgi:hypothetical protein